MSESKGLSEADQLLDKLNGTITPDGRPVIAVVDDVRANVFLVESILSEDYNVITAMSAAELWKYLQRKTPDLILLDLMMPYENGFEVLEKMKADPAMKKIPVIVVTAKDNREDVIKATKLGAADYITKPVKDDVLLTKISKVLNGS
jgi:CheY-like chemotaxis protein